MRTYLVSYDLARPNLNEPYVASALMSLGEAWARPLANVWYLRTPASEAEIEARLARLLDDADGLLVQETKGEAALVNTGLRWFRQRRRPLEVGNVIVFHAPAANDLDTEPVDIRIAS
jgi:hypothetical protein